MDGIMIGVNTVLVDNPKLTVKYVQGPNPIRIIVDSKARIPINAQVVKTARTIPTILGITSNASRRKIQLLTKMGVRILYCGKQEQVSLPLLMRQLFNLGIRRILLEGGGTLNWNMLSEHLVDQIRIAVSPQIIGGVNTVTLAEGQGAGNAKDTVKLQFLQSKKYGQDLVLFYKVLGG
jgi:2,5-diamino-6-(ribosylamino)-4(3H)-pyrimidinone 5'-phosphate reductase